MSSDHDDDRPIETSEDDARPVTLASLSERTKVFEMLAMPERLARAECALHRARGYGGAQSHQDEPESRASAETTVVLTTVAGTPATPGADHADSLITSNSTELKLDGVSKAFAASCAGLDIESEKAKFSAFAKLHYPGGRQMNQLDGDTRFAAWLAAKLASATPTPPQDSNLVELHQLSSSSGQSASFCGRIVAVGDDEDGQPRIVIHGSREQVRGAATLFNRELRFYIVPATQAKDVDKLLRIIACAYVVAGAHDADERILDVLANPEDATEEQIEAMLPYIVTESADQIDADRWRMAASLYAGFDFEYRVHDQAEPKAVLILRLPDGIGAGAALAMSIDALIAKAKGHRQ